MRVKLKELGEVITGNTPSKMILDYWDSDDISFVKPDIISDSGITTIVESSEYLSEKAREKARIVSENAIFVTCIGSIGKIGIAGPGYYAFNQQINVIVPNENVVPKYLAYAMLHSKPQLTAIANAPVVPIINKSQFSDFEINIDADMKKQVEIVNVLDKVVGIIQASENELSKLDDLVKARFVELFGDIITNEKKWRTDNWCNVLKIVNGKNQKAVESEDGEYLICGSGGAMGRATNYLTKENSVIIGRKGNINKPILMREKYWNVDTAFGIEPNEEYINIDYLYIFCIFFDFENLNKAVTIPSLTRADLLNIEMPIPEISVQNQFATFVEQVDKSKAAVQKSLDKLQILFDKLMQEYFG